MSINKMSAIALFGNYGSGDLDHNNDEIDLNLDLEPEDHGVKREQSANSSGKQSANDFIAANPDMPYSLDDFEIVKMEIDDLKAMKAFVLMIDRTISDAVFHKLNDLGANNSVLAYRSTSLAATQQTPEVIFGAPVVWQSADPYYAPEDTEPSVHKGDVYVPCVWIGAQWGSDGMTMDLATAKKKITGRPIPNLALPLENKGVSSWYASKHNKTESFSHSVEYNNGLREKDRIAPVLCMPLGIKASEIAAYQAMTPEQRKTNVHPYKAAFDRAGLVDFARAAQAGTATGQLAQVSLDQWIKRFNEPRVQGAENLQWLREYTRSKFGGYAINIPRNEPGGVQLTQGAYTQVLELAREAAEGEKARGEYLKEAHLYRAATAQKAEDDLLDLDLG